MCEQLHLIVAVHQIDDVWSAKNDEFESIGEIFGISDEGGGGPVVDFDEVSDELIKVLGAIASRRNQHDC